MKAISPLSISVILIAITLVGATGITIIVFNFPTLNRQPLSQCDSFRATLAASYGPSVIDSNTIILGRGPIVFLNETQMVDRTVGNFAHTIVYGFLGDYYGYGFVYFDNGVEYIWRCAP